MTAGRLMKMRLIFGQPWLRMTCIIIGCAIFTLAAAAVVWADPGQRWFSKARQQA